MRRIPFLLLLTLAMSGCKRSTTILGEWDGRDTTLYLTCYRERCFDVIDSIRVNDGHFLWKGKLHPELLYGLSDNKKSRHPAVFFPDREQLAIRLWPNGEMATTGSDTNRLLQRTLATDYDADTLVSRHPEIPVTAYIASRFLVSIVPYDSLLKLRKKITLSHHPYIEELDATLEAISRIHPGAFAPPVKGIELQDTTLLVFHATWCPDCLAAWPSVNTFLEEHPDVHLAALDIDSIGWDGEAAKAYAVRGVPSVFLIAKGKILRTSL